MNTAPWRSAKRVGPPSPARRSRAWRWTRCRGSDARGHIARVGYPRIDPRHVNRPSDDERCAVQGAERAPALVVIPPATAVVEPARRDELVVVNGLDDRQPGPVGDDNRRDRELGVELVGVDELRAKPPIKRRIAAAASGFQRARRAMSARRAVPSRSREAWVTSASTNSPSPKRLSGLAVDSMATSWPRRIRTSANPRQCTSAPRSLGRIC